MQLARVIGEVVATAKDANLAGTKLLVLQPLAASGEAVGRTLVAVDSVGAYLLGFETLGVQHLHQAEQLGLGVAYADPHEEGGVGRLKIAGVGIEKATKIFRIAAYGEAF